MEDIERKRVAADEFERRAGKLPCGFRISLPLPELSQRCSREIHEEEREHGIVVARGKAWSRNAEPCKATYLIEGAGERHGKGRKPERSSRQSIRDEEGDLEKDGSFPSIRNMPCLLQERIDERAGAHAEDDAEIDRRIDSCNGRDSPDGCSKCQVASCALQVVPREAAHDTCDEEESPGDGVSPDILERRREPCKPEAEDDCQVIAGMKPHHRNDREATDDIEEAETPGFRHGAS